MSNIEIENTIEVLKTVQYVWADQVSNGGQAIADYDAIEQTIKCLEEYKRDMEQTIKEQVYETGRYNKNIQQLKIDFNNLPEMDRDVPRISRLYPDYDFHYDIRDNKIDWIIKY